MSEINSVQELEEIKKIIDKGNSLLSKAQGRMESLEQQEKEVHKEAFALGVKPENLEEEIKAIDEEYMKLMNEIKKLLPYDILSN